MARFENVILFLFVCPALIGFAKVHEDKISGYVWDTSTIFNYIIIVIGKNYDIFAYRLQSIQAHYVKSIQ